jgi:hypothetical protein
MNLLDTRFRGYDGALRFISVLDSCKLYSQKRFKNWNIPVGQSKIQGKADNPKRFDRKGLINKLTANVCSFIFPT